MRVVSEKDWLSALKKNSEERPFFAMYSTLWSGVVTEPALMVLPLDDHMVHRGDGIFEAMRVVNKRPYLLEPHLERLFTSAKALDLKVPLGMEEIKELCHDLSRRVESPEGILRLFVSRGPGDFSVNPYATVGHQLYIIAVKFSPPSAEKYENGASLMLSKVPYKPAPYASIKSCNYLFNVMMKKETIDAGFDFCVGLNGDGKIAEGPTENILILNGDGELCAPKFDYTLRGTTLVRMLKLAESLRANTVADSGITGIVMKDVTIEELTSAREVMMVGTALGVMPVVQFESKKIGNGRPGPVAKELQKLFLKDIG